jgi:hypothetical protein
MSHTAAQRGRMGQGNTEGAPCNEKFVILVAAEIAVIGGPRGDTRPRRTGVEGRGGHLGHHNVAYGRAMG